MNLSTSALYKTGAGLIALLLLLAWAMGRFQSQVLSALPAEEQRAPRVSPNQQVEFESGELARALRQKQVPKGANP